MAATMRRKMRAASIIALVSGSLTSGCMGIDPVTYTAVKLSIDGLSYIGTGKSSTDHALSAVTGYDCNMLNIFSRERAICEGWEEGEPDSAKSYGPLRQPELAAAPYMMMDASLEGSGTGNDGVPYYSLWAPQH
ncbi:hypothetical protein [Aestuariispira insulae]|uniref:Uncharacterized protein n=1 Tax=Aestuariispira insulae TaxID=1461337 RepID=A0A3D9HGC7_9PROT|nr:hypothetical protein [Aestuariispira insulae]RED48539.1 hypothetical protein DFP90_10742 [Aestuariispira insulae]